MSYVHRMHIDARATHPKPRVTARPVEISADAEIAIFLRAFAVFFVVMVAAIALVVLG